jgi:hypothetical protein
MTRGFLFRRARRSFFDSMLWGRFCHYVNGALEALPCIREKFYFIALS